MLEAFAERYWHWAQCMAIANGVFYRRTQAGQALGPAIEGLDEALQAGQAPGKDERDQTLTAAIEVGFEEMEPNLRERAEALVIAPEDVDLPIACLGAIWALDAYLAEDHCLNLADLGILQAVDLKAGTVRLHDNILWYLETHLSEQRRTQLHLAAVHWMRPKSGTWADLSPHNLYAWGALRHHLERAGLGEELNALLKNFSYIEARLATMGVGGLMAAYMPPPADEGAALVGRAIALGTPQISKDKRSLGQMLLGRLVHAQSAGLQNLCDDISKSIKPLIVRRSTLGPIGQELFRLVGHGHWVTSVAFSPDGRRIVSGSHDNTLRLWDAETGAAIGAPLEGHEGAVMSVAFSPDGRRIVSGSWDRTLRLWDAETGAAIGAPLEGHGGRVRSVAFSPDGTRLATGSDDEHRPDLGRGHGRGDRPDGGA